MARSPFDDFVADDLADPAFEACLEASLAFQFTNDVGHGVNRRPDVPDRNPRLQGGVKGATFIEALAIGLGEDALPIRALLKKNAHLGGVTEKRKTAGHVLRSHAQHVK